MTTTVTNIPIHRITEDCLELIFSWCGSCPMIKCTLSQVCKHWRVILHRPTLWRQLTFDKPSLFGSIYKEILSPSWIPHDAIRHIIISKPIESQRHSHVSTLTSLSLCHHVRHVTTYRLCLAEINDILDQLIKKGREERDDALKILNCHTIETWCVLDPLDIVVLLSVHPNLHHVALEFADVSGFTSIMERTTASTATFSDQPPVDNDKMTTLSIVQIRDTEHFQLVRLVTEMTLLQEEGMDMSYNVKTRWTALTLRQVNKYRWLMILGNLRHLTFGYCHTWPAEVWKQAVLPRCSTLESLELHGWMGLHHGTQQYQRYNSSNRLLIQKEAEDAIVSCFGALSDQLQSLILVDFWVTGKMKISSTSAHAPYRDSQQPNSLSPMRRKKILLKYTLESFQEEKYPIDHMLNDIHDFILYHQSQGHDVKLELDPQWKMYHQRWLLLQK